MKKKYIIPATTLTQLHLEGMLLNTSPGLETGGNTSIDDESQVLSNGRNQGGIWSNMRDDD